MLSSEIATLLAEAISHLNMPYQQSRAAALRDLTFKMMKQGLGESSAFEQEKSRIYYDAFSGYAVDVFSKMKSVLEEIGFDAGSGSEADLLDLLQRSLTQAYDADIQSLKAIRKNMLRIPESGFEVHYNSVLAKLNTEIKILCIRMRTRKESEKAQASAHINYYLQGTNSRLNINSTDNSINIITEAELFTKLREVVEAEITNPDSKQRLLKKINDGVGIQKRTKMFDNWFTQFLALASDCITVFQPFIPALIQLLTQPV